MFLENGFACSLLEIFIIVPSLDEVKIDNVEKDIQPAYGDIGRR